MTLIGGGGGGGVPLLASLRPPSGLRVHPPVAVPSGPDRGGAGVGPGP